MLRAESHTLLLCSSQLPRATVHVSNADKTVNLRIEVPANLELLLKQRAEQAGVPVESFVLQAVTDRLAEGHIGEFSG